MYPRRSSVNELYRLTSGSFRCAHSRRRDFSNASARSRELRRIGPRFERSPSLYGRGVKLTSESRRTFREPCLLVGRLRSSPPSRTRESCILEERRPSAADLIGWGIVDRSGNSEMNETSKFYRSSALRENFGVSERTYRRALEDFGISTVVIFVVVEKMALPNGTQVNGTAQ